MTLGYLRLLICILLGLWFIEVTTADSWVPLRMMAIWHMKVITLGNIGIILSVTDMVISNFFPRSKNLSCLILAIWVLIGVQLICGYYAGMTVINLFQRETAVLL